VSIPEGRAVAKLALLEAKLGRQRAARFDRKHALA
jgi:hypothetical protein